MVYGKTHAILIIAGLFILISCSNSDTATKQSATDDSSRVENTIALDDEYSNAEYDISFRMPSSWILVEEPQPNTQGIAINLFKKGTGAEKELPLHVHAEAEHSYIAIIPGGWGTELPNSQYTSFGKTAPQLNLAFDIDTSRSKVLQLKDGTPWAYFIAPEDPPTNWSDSGFIFAQIQTKEHELYCLDAETEKRRPAKQCDYAKGDKYIREGVSNEQDAAAIQAILENISLEQIEEQETASDMIEVEKPLPNKDIRSPFTIRGEAKGYWYFEGSFVVKLYDANDNLLAEQPVEAQGQWTTEDFVPFETTITFNAPDDQRGRLVFERANPSGLPENEQSYSIPVIFPPK